MGSAFGKADGPGIGGIMQLFDGFMHRSQVPGEMELQLLSTLETVEVETPASFATSRIVTGMGSSL